jgi:large repetitive protein
MTTNSASRKRASKIGLGALAIAAIFVIFVSPLFSFAAGPTITLSVGGPYTLGQSISISGTVTPATATTLISIKIYNPSGVLTAINEPSVSQTTGAFSWNTTSGTSGNWVNGTYSVTASFSGATPVTQTFQMGTTTSTTGTGTGATTIIENFTTSVVTTEITTVTAATTVNSGTTIVTTVGGATVTSVTTVQNNTTTTVSGGSATLAEALGAVGIVVGIIAIALVFMRRK